jgi:hypothetical protein
VKSNAYPFRFVEILALLVSTEPVEKLWIARLAHWASHSANRASRVLHNRAASTESGCRQIFAAQAADVKDFHSCQRSGISREALLPAAMNRAATSCRHCDVFEDIVAVERDLSLDR